MKSTTITIIGNKSNGLRPNLSINETETIVANTFITPVAPTAN